MAVRSTSMGVAARGKSRRIMLVCSGSSMDPRNRSRYSPNSLWLGRCSYQMRKATSWKLEYSARSRMS